MGNVRCYDPIPPAKTDVDTSQFPLKLATISRDTSKSGWASLKISLSNEIRALHLDHPVHGAKWREMILDFDRKPIDKHLVLVKF